MHADADLAIVDPYPHADNMTDLVTLIGTSLPRTVARWFPDVVWQVDTDERVAYLTFDDGPNPGLTEAIASILEKHDALATFFVLGEGAERYPELVRHLAEAGHTIGNHTFTHVDGWRADDSRVLDDMDRATKVLEDVVGSEVSWMRPPYGRFTKAMRRWCRERGQTMTMWDLGTGDFLDRVDDRHVIRHVEAYVRPGSVIVLHDNTCCAETTPRALDGMLERLSAKGWRFAALPAGL